MELTPDELKQLKKLIQQNNKTLVRLRKAAQQNHDAGYASCFPELEVAEALKAGSTQLYPGIK
jgi:hypothetical protein